MAYYGQEETKLRGEGHVVSNTVASIGGNELVIPNMSGQHPKAPLHDYDLANKKYVDDQIGGIDSHDELGNLTWSTAGHTMDAALAMGSNNITGAGTVGCGAITSTGTSSFGSGSTVTTLALGGGTITDTSGNITFNDENLVTTGTLGCGAITTSATLSGSAITCSTVGCTTITASDAITGTSFSGSSTISAWGDNTTSGSAYVPMILFGTNSTPPTASGYPRGSLYFQYTP